MFSIQEIYEELEIGKDELWDWVKKQDKTAWFLPVDDKETQRCFKKIAVWIMNSSQFKYSAKNEFLSIADPWLIAKALTGNYTVVTYEKSDAKYRRKVYIPDVCNQFQVPYMNTLSLLRKMGMKF